MVSVVGKGEQWQQSAAVIVAPARLAVKDDVVRRRCVAHSVSGLRAYSGLHAVLARQTRVDQHRPKYLNAGNNLQQYIILQCSREYNNLTIITGTLCTSVPCAIIYINKTNKVPLL